MRGSSVLRLTGVKSAALIGAALLLSGSAFASPRLASARTLEGGSWSFRAFWVSDESDLEFDLSGGSNVSVPLQNGTTSQFFAASDVDLEFESRRNGTLLETLWRPAYGFQYGLRFGLSDFEVRVPSGGGINEISSTAPGPTLGLSLGWAVVPDTPVSPAVAVRAAYERSWVRLDRLKGVGGTTAADFSYDDKEWTGELAVSKSFSGWHPFAGLRYLWNDVTLTDQATGERVRGRVGGYAAFGGIGYEISPGEGLLFEASLGDEKQMAIGWVGKF